MPRLDGIPLALELAAARVATMPLRRIADRLDDRFRLLDSATRATPSRHRSLAAAVAWTYDLLAEEERLLFERLSVFAGGFTLDAVEAIAAGDDVASDEAAEVLSRLVARSLVQLEPGAGGEAATGCWRPPASTGGSGWRSRRWPATCSSGTPSTTCRWPRRPSLACTRPAPARGWSVSKPTTTTSGPPLSGPSASAVTRRWELAWSGCSGTPGTCGARGGRACTGWRPLRSLGWIGPERAKLLSAGALFHLGRGEFDAVEMMAAEELALARAARDRCWEGDALALLATVAWARGEFSRAQRQYGDAIAASLDAGDLWRASMAETQLARLHRDRGDLAQRKRWRTGAGQRRTSRRDVVLGRALDCSPPGPAGGCRQARGW